MSKLEGNPYINWKKVQFKLNDTLYECQARVIESNLCNSGVAYHLRFSNKDIVIGHIGENWHQLNNPTELAKQAGYAIEKHVDEVSRREADIRREKNKKYKGQHSNWGQNASKSKD